MTEPVEGRVDPLQAREERRLVTVLFADVVGSTSLGESLDPEDVRALLARLFAIARDADERHSGLVEKYIGDTGLVDDGMAILERLGDQRQLERVARERLDGRLGGPYLD